MASESDSDSKITLSLTHKEGLDLSNFVSSYTVRRKGVDKGERVVRETSRLKLLYEATYAAPLRGDRRPSPEDLQQLFKR